MLQRSFKSAKCKTELRLAIARIKLMKNKRENHLKQMKRELAQLLETRQDQKARIRVEHVVQEEKTIAAYDLIGIYCEIIVARLPIIESQKSCPIDLKEAVTSIVFAAPRCADIPELEDIRKHFTTKYGKEFINGAIELRPECGVSRLLVEKLSAKAPDGQTKLKILAAIANEHNIQWDPKSFGEKESTPYDDLLKGPPANNVKAPQGSDQKRDSPVNYQHNLHSSSSQKFAASDFSGDQSAPSPAHPSPMRSSETVYQRTESRNSHPRNEKSSSFNSQNWNMEFKDATAAAQAAAESAEQASIAARAAAELLTRERITRQHNASHESNDVDEKSYNDELKSAYSFSSQSAPSRSSTASTSIDKYSQKIPFRESSQKAQISAHSDSDDESKKSSFRTRFDYDDMSSPRVSISRLSSSEFISSKRAEESPTYSRNSKSSSRLESGFSSSRMGPKIVQDNSSSRTQFKTYDLATGKKEGYLKSKFSAPSGYFNPNVDSDSEDDIPKRPSRNPNNEAISHSRMNSGSPESVNSGSVSGNRLKPRSQSEKHSAVEQSLSFHKTATSSSGEAPSRESSLKKASHVHPKLPDYDSLAAHFQSLKQNRR